jgi:membrane associated rhomboid family serine protease
MAAADPSDPLRVAADRRRIDEWALALTSAGIEVRVDETYKGAALHVHPGECAYAEAVLAAYEAENPPRETPPADISVDRNSYGAYVIAVVLAAFFAVTGSRATGRPWFERGAAVASRIRAGELWRTVTALTLHADGMHILGNAITLIIFGTSLCGALGAGAGLWLMLLAGALGNAMAAGLRGAPYSSVGASTSIFGAIGALAGIQLVRRRRGAAVSRWHIWAPIAAGLALLGLLGTSPEADVLAHLFGFIAGMLLALPATRLSSLRDHAAVQAALAIAAAGVVAGCWLRAMR